jgi:hypothetical protein
MAALIIVVIISIIVFALYRASKKPTPVYELPSNTQQLLETNVPFYNALDPSGKTFFEARIKDFLASVSIRGICVDVDDLDRILVASGAIMLIFSFPDWKYNNISEVLLYPNSFDREFSQDAPERNVLGMVGDGAMHREMILSKSSLHTSFSNPVDGENTVIHEFAHLIDKADGATDGIPEYLLSKVQVLPWINLVRETINEMRKKRHSDIDLYGATNETEFFAVITEYFFERPDKLKEHHPELFAMLEQMFHLQAQISP